MNKLKKTPRWKKEQKIRKKKDSQIQLGLGLAFILLIGLLISINYLWKKAKNSIWDGESRLTIVSQTDDGMIVTVALPSQSKTVNFTIPLETVVKVPFEFGEYQVGKVFALGNLELKGGRLLMRSVQDMLGLGIEGYKVNQKTNLSWLDRIRWQWFDKVSSKQTLTLDLLVEAAITQKQLDDNSVVYIPSHILIDELVNQFLFDEEMVNEGLRVAILNASGVSGVADEAARLINNLGIEVSFVGNADEQLKSEIRIKDSKLLTTNTLKQLSRTFMIEEIKVVETAEYRADVVLIISKDYTSLK